MRVLNALLVISLQCSLILGDSPQLKFVQIVFRHGDRSPVKKYPNDPNLSKWPDGMDQLTTIGMQQHYELGGWLAERYKDLLGPRYSPSAVYYRSSDKDRTLMSAGAQLASLFAPDSTRKFNQSLNWQPVPIHTVELETDTLVYDPKCPTYERMLDEVMNSEEVQAIATENAALFQHITEHAGMLINVTNFDEVYDPGNCERLHNMTQPEWYNETVFEQLRSLNNLRWHWRNYNRSMSRLVTGVMNSALLSNMRSAQLDSSVRKFVGYSAHDTNLAALLHALDVWNGRAPPYATCLILELSHDVQNDRWLVAVLLRNSTDVEPYQLALPRCSKPCTLDKFSEALDDVILAPENWKAECGLAESPAFRTPRGLPAEPIAHDVSLVRDGNTYVVTVRMTPLVWFFAVASLALVGAIFFSLITYSVYSCCCSKTARTANNRRSLTNSEKLLYNIYGDYDG